MATATSIFSEEAEAAVELKEKREKEREERGLQLGDTRARVKKYDRLKKKNKLKGIDDKKLKRFLKTSDSVAERAARKAARSELLLQEEPGYLEAEGSEKTYQFKQKDIAAVVPIATMQQFFNLKLDTFGPYSVNYSLNGRYVLLGGQKGHLATFDWQDKELRCEFHVHQTVRDVQFLHNEMMFAAAQKRYVYIYDHTGMELHCLKQMTQINCLTFLPYHFLLVAASDRGNLHYLDSSVGRLVTTRRTQLGSLHCMAQNPHNAIIHLGHHNGTVSLWSPNVTSPLVKMLCHRGPLTDLAVERGGWAMVTVGMDAHMKIWDIRSTYREVQSYRTRRPASCVSVSQRGLVGIGKGRVVEVWRDLLTKGADRQSGPYMTHKVDGDVTGVEFCPYQDTLGIGHANGFSSMIVPGAGEANFDALEANPFQTRKQRQEEEVKKLLEKIPSELISLDPTQITKVHQGMEDGNEEEKGVESGTKRKTRGRGSLIKALHKKQYVKDEQGKEARRQQVQRESKKSEEELASEGPKRTKHVLDRFR